MPDCTRKKEPLAYRVSLSTDTSRRFSGQNCSFSSVCTRIKSKRNLDRQKLGCAFKGTLFVHHPKTGWFNFYGVKVHLLLKIPKPCSIKSPGHNTGYESIQIFVMVVYSIPNYSLSHFTFNKIRYVLMAVQKLQVQE